ncbi:MAG: hypothetical protein RI957_1364 [Verrucomicrobiota bacterium]|jgi:hypothetical protein
MKAKILPISLAAIVGAIGFIVGRNSQQSADADKGVVSGGTSSQRSSGSSLAGASSSDARRSAAGARAGMEKSGMSSAKGDPMDRLQELKNIVDPLERTRLWLQLVDSLSPGQFEEFVAAYRAEGIPSERMGDYAMLLTAWAKVDPQAALDYASKNTGSPFARQTILAAWAAYDPNSAIAWAKSNHQGDGANPWMVGVIKGLAAQDPDMASTLLKEMPRSVERGEALDNLIPAMLQQKGIDAARDWVNTITDSSLKDGAMSRVADRTIERDPQGTAEWLIANPSETTNRRVDDALFVMARKDETSAMALFNKLPAGNDRSNALRGIINATAIDNPQKAAALMDSHSGDVNNRVVEQFVWHSFRQDPQTAVSNISRLTNPEEQEKMYNRTLEWWMEKDQQAAINWVNSNTLPTSVVDRLNRNLQKQQQRTN